MATGLVLTNATGVSDADDFVPEVWSLETLAAYKANVVMAALVTMLSHSGKKGDIINIPVPARGDALQKTQGAAVDVIDFSSTTTQIAIDQHWYYSRVLEDILEIQGLPSIRRFFTDDAGYALAKNKDAKLHALAATWGGGTTYSRAVIGSDGTTLWDPTANANAGNATAISDPGLRKVLQSLDDQDTPGRDRYLIIPPVEKKNLLGSARFTEQAFVGESGSANSIRNGRVGNVYGVEIYVSSRCVSVADTGAATDQRACLLFQKDSLVLAEQLSPRTQQQYKLEALGTLIVSDELFGVKTVRGAAAAQADENAGCRAIIVPST